MQRIEHIYIIQLMQALGYKDDNNGVCRGVAMMGLQACTIEDIDSFNKRLDFIKQTPDLVAKIANVKAKLAAQSLEAAAPKRLTLTDEEQKIIDVIAFLEGVEIHQNPNKYARYFEKPLSQCDGEAIAKIAASKSLETSGGLYKLKAWPGIYNDEELELYFIMLKKIAHQIRQPFSIILSGGNHAIALHYNIAKATFYVIDANNLPIIPLPIGMTLAQWVKWALISSSNITAFETCIYTSGNAVEHAERLITAIYNEQDFVNLHTITALRASYTDCHKNSLAFIAAYHGHADVIQSLYAAGAYLNAARLNGATPAFSAAQNGHSNVILALHSASANLNTATSSGATPAYIAAQNGHADVILALHAASVNLNTVMSDGGTPAHIAACNGHVDVILALHVAGANLNIAKLDGATPALIATQYGHANVILALHAASVNLNTATSSGATPALIAACHGHVNVLQALWEAGVDLTLSTPFGTPLAMARRQGHQACIVLLENLDKNVNGQSSRFFAAQLKIKSDTINLHQKTIAGMQHAAH